MENNGNLTIELTKDMAKYVSSILYPSSWCSVQYREDCVDLGIAPGIDISGNPIPGGFSNQLYNLKQRLDSFTQGTA